MIWRMTFEIHKKGNPSFSSRVEAHLCGVKDLYTLASY